MKTIRNLLVVVLLSAAAGCVYKGAKVTEGTDLSIGLSLPATDGAAQVTVLNYLSGFRLGVAENARLTVDYTTAETNSYFGCVTIRASKCVRAVVEPCESEDQGGAR